MDAPDLRYPVGRYQPLETVTAADRDGWITDVAAAPAALRAAVEGLNDEQLDTPYRPGGWTVRQLVHHVADSHYNALVRFKLALTEDEPAIKPYDEARWAELADSRGPIAPSLAILDGLHARWIDLLQAMDEADWPRTFFHPERGRALRLDWTLGLYAWHGRHHVAHVTRLAEREGW